MSTRHVSAAEFRASSKGAKTTRLRGIAPKEERTHGGRTYHSKGERVMAERLDILKRAGIVRAWTPGVKVALLAYRAGGIQYVNGVALSLDGVPLIWDAQGVKVCDYVIDFHVVLSTGVEFWIEVKMDWAAYQRTRAGGHREVILKVRHFRAQFPDRHLMVAGYNKGGFTCWPDTSLEELHLLAEAGIVIRLAP